MIYFAKVLVNGQFTMFDMPLIFQKHTDNSANLGVWRIAEPESYFLEVTGLSPRISHPHKKLQHLAGRRLLRELAPALPLSEIRPSASGKPAAGEGHPHFSISHCGPFAAAIVSGDHTVGIDIELPKEKILAIRSKFLTPEEEAILLDAVSDPVLAFTYGWCIKEALFKWNGEGRIDFRMHMAIRDFIMQEGVFRARCEMNKGSRFMIQAAGCMIDGAVLCWVIS